MIIPNIPTSLSITPIQDLISSARGNNRIQDNNLMALERSRDESGTVFSKSSMVANVLGNNIDITA
jgi:hypothetical protein